MDITDKLFLSIFTALVVCCLCVLLIIPILNKESKLHEEVMYKVRIVDEKHFEIKRDDGSFIRILPMDSTLKDYFNQTNE